MTNTRTKIERFQNKASSAPTNNESEQQHRPYAHFESSVTSKVISFYLSETIGDQAAYTDMIHRIKTASEHDVIYVYLNTPGGNLYTGMQMINAFRQTAARVITVLESHAHSLGTLLFLSGHEWHVMDDCQMMFHNFSSGTYGKGNEQIAEVQANVKWFNKIMRKICYPFLSHEEINFITEGRDLWLDSDDIRKRLNKMAKDAAPSAIKPPPAPRKRNPPKPIEDVSEIVPESAVVKRPQKATGGDTTPSDGE